MGCSRRKADKNCNVAYDYFDVFKLNGAAKSTFVKVSRKEVESSGESAFVPVEIYFCKECFIIHSIFKFYAICVCGVADQKKYSVTGDYSSKLKISTHFIDNGTTKSGY